jgi:hypothetical protein
VLAIALMMEAANTSEMLINFYLTTRRYNPEDSHLKAYIPSAGQEFRRYYAVFTRRARNESI